MNGIHASSGPQTSGSIRTALPPVRAERMVVGIDGSVHSPPILMLAAALADVLKLRMDVVACWHHTDIYAASQIPNPGLPEGDPFQTETANMAEHVIDLAFGTEAPAGMTFHTRYGHPARILEGESATARLLAVGRRGSGGFLGLRIGSVTASCVARARCPVLIVNDN